MDEPSERASLIAKAIWDYLTEDAVDFRPYVYRRRPEVLGVDGELNCRDLAEAIDKALK